jgi:hypothetical protein
MKRHGSRVYVSGRGFVHMDPIGRPAGAPKESSSMSPVAQIKQEASTIVQKIDNAAKIEKNSVLSDTRRMLNDLAKENMTSGSSSSSAHGKRKASLNQSIGSGLFLPGTSAATHPIRVKSKPPVEKVR